VLRPPTRLIDIRQHRLGPRVYIGGLRVHECWAGLGTIAIVTSAQISDHQPYPRLATVAAVIATWMMIKDWPDFFPSRRDTYSWRVGLHRRGRAQATAESTAAEHAFADGDQVALRQPSK
jgi:hypothetical protein